MLAQAEMKFPNPFRAIVALFRAAKIFFSGEDLFVPESEFELRRLQCEKCQFFYPSDRQCGHCSCFVDVKARLTSEKCPIDKW